MTHQPGTPEDESHSDEEVAPDGSTVGEPSATDSVTAANAQPVIADGAKTATADAAAAANGEQANGYQPTIELPETIAARESSERQQAARQNATTAVIAGAVPAQGTPAPGTTEVRIVKPAKPRRKRRGVIILISVIVVLALLVVAFFVAERIARTTAETRVRDQIVAGLGLDNGSGVHVDLGGGIFLLQLLAGSINNVDITVDEFTVGELSGSADLSASGVPLDQSSPVDTLAVTVTIPGSQLTNVTNLLSGVDLDSVTIDDGLIRIATNFSLLGAEIPVAVGIEPGVDGGDLTFTPTTVEAAGTTTSVDDLRSGFLGGLIGGLFDTQSFCVASELPEAFTLQGVDVVDGSTADAPADGEVVITLTGDGAVLGGDALTVKGSCD